MQASLGTADTKETSYAGNRIQGTYVHTRMEAFSRVGRASVRHEPTDMFRSNSNFLTAGGPPGTPYVCG